MKIFADRDSVFRTAGVMSEAGTAAQNAAVPALRQAAQVCPAARRTFGIGDTAVLTILLGCFLFLNYIL